MQDITKNWPPEHIECSMVITVCGVSGRMILEVQTVIKMPRKQKYQTYKRVPGTRTIPSKPHNVGAPSSILNSGLKKTPISARISLASVEWLEVLHNFLPASTSMNGR